MCTVVSLAHIKPMVNFKMRLRIQGVTKETANLISAKSGGKVELFRKDIVQRY